MMGLVLGSGLVSIMGFVLVLVRTASGLGFEPPCSLSAAWMLWTNSIQEAWPATRALACSLRLRAGLGKREGYGMLLEAVYTQTYTMQKHCHVLVTTQASSLFIVLM